MTGPLLEVIDVHKRYGNMAALSGVSFEVMRGEIFGLLGPNGAGKTTLLSILSCLSQATSGSIRLLGKPVVMTDLEVRRLIGIVPQDLALYEQLTARENLIFFGELFGVSGVELHETVESLLKAVGLDSRAGDRVGTFSGGMKRRLNLAAALVHKPQLLMLDEPTVGVDPQSRNLIFEEVKRLNAEGLTVIYTSHYMEEVETLCTRIGIIDHGKLEACDTLSGLVQRLQGMIRCRLSAIPSSLLARLETEGGNLSEAISRTTGKPMPHTVIIRQLGEDELEIECPDVKRMLIRLVGLINEAGVELLHLETVEPNLERVFLHLTGRALRD